MKGYQDLAIAKRRVVECCDGAVGILRDGELDETDPFVPVLPFFLDKKAIADWPNLSKGVLDGLFVDRKADVSHEHA